MRCPGPCRPGVPGAAQYPAPGDAEERKTFAQLATVNEVGKIAMASLTICRRIVEDHGGQIDADSRVGEGTTMRIRLPAYIQEKGR